MKVYSLLGFFDYEGSDLVGVFGDMQSLMDCVIKVNCGRGWSYDYMGYVESELGSMFIEDVLGVVEYIPFIRINGEIVEV